MNPKATTKTPKQKVIGNKPTKKDKMESEKHLIIQKEGREGRKGEQRTDVKNGKQRARLWVKTSPIHNHIKRKRFKLNVVIADSSEKAREHSMLLTKHPHEVLRPK